MPSTTGEAPPPARREYTTNKASASELWAPAGASSAGASSSEGFHSYLSPVCVAPRRIERPASGMPPSTTWRVVSPRSVARHVHASPDGPSAGREGSIPTTSASDGCSEATAVCRWVHGDGDQSADLPLCSRRCALCGSCCARRTTGSPGRGKPGEAGGKPKRAPSGEAREGTPEGIEGRGCADAARGAARVA